MATINFFIQSKKSPAGIYVRLRDGRYTDAKAKTRFAVNPEQWSAAKGQPKNLNDVVNKKLNQQLSDLKADLLAHFNNSVGKQEINSKWLKDFINPPDNDDKIPTKLVEYFDYYALHKKGTIEKSTHKKLIVNKRLIERFQIDSKQIYHVKDVNANFKLEFEKYCISQNYAPNTIARAIKFIKTLCYHAQSNGIETHFQLSNIAVKIEKVKSIFLSPEEIQKIENVELEAEHLVNARDWLIISCETGQRVSDFMRFTKDLIRIESGVKLIEFTQVKTGKMIAIPVSKKVQNILDRRNGNFPRKISDQRYNDYIKEVCKKAQINEKTQGSKPHTNGNGTRKMKGTFEKWELVTSHIGRRSFSTNYFGHIPTSLLIGVTGHSTEKMFLTYIGKTETQKAIQLAEYIK
ncbi:MAG: site-specific integrase [Flavobacteriales bacterium]|nr:site-specific integrase [Flavobacteriales bacterium]